MSFPPQGIVPPLMVAIAVAMGGGRIAAQTNITPVTIEMTVGPVFRLVVTPTSINLGTPTLADFANTHKDADHPLTLTAMANRSYMVTIGVDDGTDSFDLDGNPGTKPADDLTWALTLGGPYTSVVTGGTVMSGAATTSSDPQSVFFRTLWNLEQAAPGEHSILVNLTISAP